MLAPEHTEIEADVNESAQRKNLEHTGSVMTSPHECHATWLYCQSQWLIVWYHLSYDSQSVIGSGLNGPWIKPAQAFGIQFAVCTKINTNTG